MAESCEKRVSYNVPASCFQEIKCLAKPPVIVIKVLSAVLTLLGYPGHKTDWNHAKKFLGNTSAAKELRDFDLSKCSKETAGKAKDIVKDLSVELVKNVSKATVAFYMWTKEVTEYVESN